MQPTILVLFGATGDLAAREIIPALFRLFQKEKFPEKIAVVGFARRALDDNAFKQLVIDAVRDKDAARNKDAFVNLFQYEEGLLEEASDYSALAEKLNAIDEEWGVCSNKLFYLAVPPHLYETIFKHLALSGLSEPCGDPNWTRVIVEKPFGEDLETAQRIDVALGKTFKEEQIYRIDHYLGKEMVQNILTFRFTNTIFEHIWHGGYIERIDVRLNETMGVENRGGFYDQVGALRDVGQNHLLQMLALATMEHPGSLDPAAIRKARLEALKRVAAPLPKHAFRAEYEGYHSVEGVEKESKTETYFKLKTAINAPRWKDVPVYIEAGKKLAEEKKDVMITFRHPEPCMCHPDAKEHLKNKIVFCVEPEERITIYFYAKKPGGGMEVEQRALDFAYHKPSDGSIHTRAYERLIFDCIRGDQTLFVSTEEVEAMWKFIDPIVAAWKADAVPLEKYEPGTDKVRDTADKFLISN